MYLKIIVVCVIFANCKNDTLLTVKGFPFSMSSQVSLGEEYINAINKNNLEKDVFLSTIKNTKQLSSCAKLFREIILHKKSIGNSYDLRVGFYFKTGNLEETYYFDRFQRLVFKGKVYKLTEQELKAVFSFICTPNFKHMKGNFTEQHFWQYSPKCK